MENQSIDLKRFRSRIINNHIRNELTKVYEFYDHVNFGSNDFSTYFIEQITQLFEQLL